MRNQANVIMIKFIYFVVILAEMVVGRLDDIIGGGYPAGCRPTNKRGCADKTINADSTRAQVPERIICSGELGCQNLIVNDANRGANSVFDCDGSSSCRGVQWTDKNRKSGDVTINCDGWDSCIDTDYLGKGGKGGAFTMTCGVKGVPNYFNCGFMNIECEFDTCTFNVEAKGALTRPCKEPKYCSTIGADNTIRATDSGRLVLNRKVAGAISGDELHVYCPENNFCEDSCTTVIHDKNDVEVLTTLGSVREKGNKHPEIPNKITYHVAAGKDETDLSFFCHPDLVNSNNRTRKGFVAYVASGTSTPKRFDPFIFCTKNLDQFKGIAKCVRPNGMPSTMTVIIVIVVIAVVVVAAGVGYLYWMKQQQGGPPPPAPEAATGPVDQNAVADLNNGDVVDYEQESQPLAFNREDANGTDAFNTTNANAVNAPVGFIRRESIINNGIAQIDDGTTLQVAQLIPPAGWKCDGQHNFVDGDAGFPYNQVDLSDESGVRIYGEGGDVLGWCVENSPPDAVGFFYQMHNNGHEIVGYFSDWGAENAQRMWMGAIQGAVCFKEQD